MDLSLVFLVVIAIGFYLAWTALGSLRWETFLDPERAGQSLLRPVLALVLGWAAANAIFGFLQVLLSVFWRLRF